MEGRKETSKTRTKQKIVAPLQTQIFAIEEVFIEI
jgi:hypothetical protein